MPQNLLGTCGQNLCLCTLFLLDRSRNGPVSRSLSQFRVFSLWPRSAPVTAMVYDQKHRKRKNWLPHWNGKKRWIEVGEKTGFNSTELRKAERKIVKFWPYFCHETLPLGREVRERDVAWLRDRESAKTGLELKKEERALKEIRNQATMAITTLIKLTIYSIKE